MKSITIDTHVSSLLSYYKHEHRIYGRCPSCGEPFRLSEVKLTYGKEPPRDLLSRMKRERDRLTDEIQQLENSIEQSSVDYQQKIESLEFRHEDQLDALNSQWLGKVDTQVERALLKERTRIRKDAIARARVTQLGKTLEKIAPMFPGFGHHPYDVRPIFDPIDFVVFNGYFSGEVTDITFVEFKTGQSRMSNTQKSIRDVIDRRKVNFEEKRLTADTLRMLTGGRTPRSRRLVE